MRTTVAIDDDIFAAAKELANTRGMSLGAALSDLARRGLRGSVAKTTHGNFPTFDVTAKTKPMTNEMVERALDDE
jgi:hypothetical protein